GSPPGAAIATSSGEVTPPGERLQRFPQTGAAGPRPVAALRPRRRWEKSISQPARRALMNRLAQGSTPTDLVRELPRWREPTTAGAVGVLSPRLTRRIQAWGPFFPFLACSRLAAV